MLEMAATIQRDPDDGDSVIDAVSSVPLLQTTDGALLVRFVEGDAAAFAVLVQRHSGLVAGVCRRLLREPSDAEDAVQATFMVLARRARHLVRAGSIAGWLHETARRTALKLRRSSLRRQRAEDAAVAARPSVAPPSANPAHQAAVRELAAILDAELARLPLRFREVILLNQVEGLSRQEIAQRLRISLPSVKDRLQRGRQRLTTRLSKRGTEVSAALIAAWLVPGSAKVSTAALATAEAATAFAAGSASSPTLTSAAALAQGVLKMLGLEKLKMMTICLFSLLTATTIAFGALRDEPKRFEKGLRGEIVSVTTVGGKPTLTIHLDEFDTELNLDIASDAKIWTAYEEAKLDDLHKGQYVSLLMADDHRSVNRIHVRGEQREVVVSSVSPTGAITAVEAREDDDQGTNPPPPSKNFQLAEGAILRIGGLPATPADLRPGMRVPLELAADGSKVNAVEFDGDPSQILKGSASVVNEGQIKVKTEAGEDGAPALEQTLAVPLDAKLLLDGKPSRLADIKAGSEVTVRLSEDRLSARAIGAVTATSDEDPAEKPSVP